MAGFLPGITTNHLFFRSIESEVRLASESLTDMIINGEPKEDPNECELRCTLRFRLTLWSEAVDFSEKALLAPDEFCIGLVGRLARGEKFKPDLVAEGCGMRLVNAADLRPQLVYGLTTGAMLEDQPVMKPRGSGHNNTKSLTLRQTPFHFLASISRAHWVDEPASRIMTWFDDADVVRGPGEERDDLDFPVVEVIVREDGNSMMVVGHRGKERNSSTGGRKGNRPDKGRHLVRLVAVE